MKWSPAVCLLAVLLAYAPALADDIAPLDGKWSGVIHFDKEALLVEAATPTSGQHMALEIHGPVVRVSVQDDGHDIEVKPGLFHIAPVRQNAVIFATEAAPGDGWVESWVFVITRLDDGSLRVEYSRLVKNPGEGTEAAPASFATRGEGFFKRDDT